MSSYVSIALLCTALVLLAEMAPARGGKVVYCKVSTNYEENYLKNVTAPASARKYRTQDPPDPCVPALISDAADPEVGEQEFHSLLAAQLWNRPRYEFGRCSACSLA